MPFGGMGFGTLALIPIGGMGFGELVLVFAVLLLLFGAKRLPELASGMGRGIRDFKRAMSGLDDASIQAAPTTPSVQPPASPPQVESTAARPDQQKQDA